MRDTIRPVILCGGGGTRLWPLSHAAHPKQFSSHAGGPSLLQATLARAQALGLGAPLLLTRNEFRFVVAEQARCDGGALPDGATAIVIEPQPRNTAPAIAAAAHLLAAERPDALMLVMPSDHVIDAGGLARALDAAIAPARAGALVTFGVRPSAPETGFGYIELPADAPPDQPVPWRSFVEKPDVVTAQDMLRAGNFLWNSGLFLFRADALLAAMARHAPQVHDAAQRAVATVTRDLDFHRLGPEFASAPDISLDHAVMERVRNGTVVPMRAKWNDLGTWRNWWLESPRDGDGVALSGTAHALDCQDSLLMSTEGGPLVAGLGLRNLAVVATPDAVLVADLDQAQDVRVLVADLHRQGLPAATQARRDHRPWGWFEQLSLGAGYQVKRIMIHPGGKLSLQSHAHRSEHWIVVDGTARVTIGAATRDVQANQSLFVPLGARHRLENPGDSPLWLIEVQVGTYLGEDDITRHDDIYARG